MAGPTGASSLSLVPDPRSPEPVRRDAALYATAWSIGGAGLLGAAGTVDDRGIALVADLVAACGFGDRPGRREL